MRATVRATSMAANIACCQGAIRIGWKRRNLLLTLGAILIGLSLATIAAPQNVGALELGIIEGTVVSQTSKSGKPIEVVAEREGIKFRTPCDENGQFRTTLPPGVYTIYVEGAQEDVTARIKYRIEPRQTTMVNLASGIRPVYCTEEGDRVSPTGVVPFEKKGLHRPRYVTHDLNQSKPANIVIEYCDSKANKDETLYTSARLLSDGTDIFADNLVYDRQNRIVHVFDTEVIAVQHDLRITESVKSQRQIASFKDGARVDLTGGMFSANGKGSINLGRIKFEFSINRDGLSFTYTDPTGLVVKSEKSDCSFMTKSGDTLTFGGSATVTGSSPLLKTRPGPLTVGFKIEVKDRGQNRKMRDWFVIDIPELDDYHKAGQVAGEIIVMRNKNISSADRVSRLWNQ